MSRVGIARRAVLAGALASLMTAEAAARPWSTTPHPDSIVVRWNVALLQAVRNVRFAPMYTARALAIVHTCMYDAWAAYDGSAFRTRLGDTLRRPPNERIESNKAIAVSYAAHRALIDLFPSQGQMFDPLMLELGLDPSDRAESLATPEGVGNLACAAVLEFRHDDGANQLGDRNNGAYSDYTGYAPVNTPDQLVDPNRWQPLPTAVGTPQTFVAPHWRHVIPFALAAPDQFRPRPPVLYPHPVYLKQADEVVTLSARLTDRENMIAEYWEDGPSSETPPGHWNVFAQYVSRRDGHDLDADVRLFFILGNALLDASIAVWDCKVAFDYVRPVSAVRLLFAAREMILCSSRTGTE